MASKKYNRTKGHNFEREIAQDFRSIGYTDAKRNLEYNEGDTGTDLVGTGNFRVQCKSRKNYVSVNTIEEISIDSDGLSPLLITKANNKEPMAILPWRILKLYLGYYMRSFN